MQAIDAGSTGDGDGVPEKDGAPAGRFVLPRRTFLLALVGIVVLLALIVAAGVAFYSKSKAQAALRAEAQERARSERMQAAELAAARAAENLAKLEAARQAHREILESATPVPAPAVVESPLPASAPAPMPPSVNVPAAPSSAVAEPSPPKAAARKKAAPESPEQAPAIVPGPAGGCSISGSNPQDYGKALGRCLEEFNRLEGR